MGSHGKSWDSHGDCPFHQGKSENSMGCPMENHGALQQAMGNPQYAMGIMGRHGDYTCRHAWEFRLIHGVSHGKPYGVL
jgi:hypothetical protein